MRSSLSVQVTCDYCRKVGEDVLIAGGDVDAAIEGAGWRIHKGQDICPNCIEAERREEAEQQERRDRRNARRRESRTAAK